jgi:hypothetical protein
MRSDGVPFQAAYPSLVVDNAQATRLTDCLRDIVARGSTFQGLAMKTRLNVLRNRWIDKQRGGIGYVFLWLLGVPIPVLILISLLRGCN